MLPSMTNPLVLTIVNPNDGGVIPSMKNNRRPYIYYHDGKPTIGIRKDARVVRFEQAVDDLISTQMATQPVRISMPNRVAVVMNFYKLPSATNQVPMQDLDNQYTTIQEALQRNGIIENDRQVAAFACFETLVQVASAQHAVVWLWVAKSDPKEELAQFLSKPLSLSKLGSVPDMKQLALPFRLDNE